MQDFYFEEDKDVIPAPATDAEATTTTDVAPATDAVATTTLSIDRVPEDTAGI